MAAVKMSAREVERSLLDRGNDSATSARHAVGQGLGNHTSVVAETELAGANADDCTIVVAWSAITIARGCVCAIFGGLWGRAEGRWLRSAFGGWLRSTLGRWLRSAVGGLLRSAIGRLLRGADRLGDN